MTLLTAWVIYAVIGIAAYSAAFVWAVRTRQFTELDRASRIALKDLEPCDADKLNRRPGLIDRYTWLGLFLTLVAVVVWVIWTGVRRG